MRFYQIKFVFWDFLKSTLRIVIPFGIAIGIPIYFLFFSKSEDKFGSVFVSSDQPGIPIVIDGARTVFNTDTLIEQVRVGMRRISLVKEQWLVEPEFINVNVKEGDTVTVHFQTRFNPEYVLNKKQENSNNRQNSKEFSPPVVSKEPTNKTNIPIIIPKRVPKKGNIQVSCNEEGAAIYLNGSQTGLTTPAVLTNLEPGTYQISVSKNGFVVYPELATVTLDEDVGIAYTHFTLVSAAEKVKERTLIVITDPPVSNLIINGKVVGSTPFHKKYPKGRYKIEFPQVTGYLLPPPQQVFLNDQDSLVVDVKYQKISGKAYLALFVPKSADLINLGKLKIEINRTTLFNGAPAESRHVIWGSVPEGEHQVTIYFDNLSTDISLRFINGYVTPIELRFEKYFTQIRPKLRPFEPQKYEDYRQISGPVTYYP